MRYFSSHSHEYDTCHCFRERLEASLKRLGVEYIDLLVLRLHGPSDQFKTPLEEAAKGMKVR